MTKTTIETHFTTNKEVATSKQKKKRESEREKVRVKTPQRRKNCITSDYVRNAAALEDTMLSKWVHPFVFNFLFLDDRRPSNNLSHPQHCHFLHISLPLPRRSQHTPSDTPRHLPTSIAVHLHHFHHRLGSGSCSCRRSSCCGCYYCGCCYCCEKKGIRRRRFRRVGCGLSYQGVLEGSTIKQKQKQKNNNERSEGQNNQTTREMHSKSHGNTKQKKAAVAAATMTKQLWDSTSRKQFPQASST